MFWPWSVLCVWAAIGDAHPSPPTERHLCVVKCIPVWPVDPVWRGFQHDNKTAAKLWHRPICSLQLVNIHPHCLTINKGQRGRERGCSWMPGWGGGGANNPSPWQQVLPPTLQQAVRGEAGAIRFFFFSFFVGFSWKDISRSVLRRAGNQPKFLTVQTKRIWASQRDYNVKMSAAAAEAEAAMDEGRNSEVTRSFLNHNCRRANGRRGGGGGFNFFFFFFLASGQETGIDKKKKSPKPVKVFVKKVARCV